MLIIHSIILCIEETHCLYFSCKLNIHMDVSPSSLDRVLEVLFGLGSPHLELASTVIHVTGTNGKGSVCTMLFHALKKFQFSLGLFTSPHLVHINECIRTYVNKVDSLIDLNFLNGRICSLSDQFPNLTEFELLTIIAIEHFGGVSHKLDFVIIEVGVGGKFDCTNVFPEKIANVLTSVSKDHFKILNSKNLLEICKQKCGILQNSSKTPFFVAADFVPMDCLEFIGKMHFNNFNEIYFLKESGYFKNIVSKNVEKLISYDFDANLLKIPLNGRHQKLLTTLVLFLISKIIPKILCEKSESISKFNLAMNEVNVIGRLQFIPKERVILDGSHNIQSINALKEFLFENFKNEKIHIIMAFSNTKSEEDVREILEIVIGFENIQNLIFVEFSKVENMSWISPIPANNLCEIAKNFKLTFPTISIPDLKEAMSYPQTGLKVICGSLYLISEYVTMFPI